MKANFNSIGKAFKRMFSRKTQQVTSPVVANAAKKDEVKKEHKHKVYKMSESAYGRKMRNISYHRNAAKGNKVRRRRNKNKIAKLSRRTNWRLAA